MRDGTVLDLDEILIFDLNFVIFSLHGKRRWTNKPYSQFCVCQLKKKETKEMYNFKRFNVYLLPINAIRSHNIVVC